MQRWPASRGASWNGDPLMAKTVALPSRGVSGVRADLAGAARLPVGAVLKAYETDETGLTSAEAGRRLQLHGPNALRYHHVTPVAVLVRQLRNPPLFPFPLSSDRKSVA